MFTTCGISWRLPGAVPGFASVRYEQLDQDAITHKHSLGTDLVVLAENARLPFPSSEDERDVAKLASYVCAVVAATPSRLPETCWEFCASVAEGKAQSLRKFWCLGEVKKAITSHAVETKYLSERTTRDYLYKRVTKANGSPSLTACTTS